MAASTGDGLSSPQVHQSSKSPLVMGPPTPKRASSRSPPSQLSTQSRPTSFKHDVNSTSKACGTVICCDADHSVPVSCAADCRDCTSPAPASPCSDAHHISSACTEPTCGAASSSTSAVVCSAAVACCDDTACPDVPTSPCSPCSQPDCPAPGDCSSMTLALPTISTCCTDEACEPELSPRLKAKVGTVCDGVVPAIPDPHSHSSKHAHRAHTECKECRGSITSLGTAEGGGQLYSSFQELLDCCCCSMPPTVEQCCVGETPLPCTAPHPSPAEHASSAVHHDHYHSTQESAAPLPPHPPPSGTPSSSIITNATQHTSPGRDHVASRASTASTTATPQPVPASPSSALQWSSALLHASSPHSKDKFADAGAFGAHAGTVSFEDIFPGLQSWNDCTFEQPHLHSSHGGCLPPAMTLCNSDHCPTTAPHSHWMPSLNHQHTSAMQPNSSQQDARPQLCQWGGCNERFWTVEELVAHVNHSHLARKNTADGVHTPVETSFLQATEHEAKQVAAHAHANSEAQAASAHNLECLWKDCHQVPMPEKLEYGTFTPTTEAEVWKSGHAAQNDKISLAILQHLLHDHLGQHSTQPFSLKGQHLLPPTPSSHPHGSVALSSSNNSTSWNKKRKNSESSAFCSETEQLHCRWEGCSCVFDSHSALTDHIETAHVGSGKAEYECRWIGCSRHASGQKFSQKQKVLRHIQTHTGDRPFKCTQCGKRFSEQNTLAQHMRTHTLERPYVCDYPGCGKAFSVAGSLTIHKRTHTGSKPFVCSYAGCGKAFAESSNLTKHVRTHTGDKPFRCEECGKCFSRPDQASRHRKTHDRKRAKATAGGRGGGGEEEAQQTQMQMQMQMHEVQAVLGSS